MHWFIALDIYVPLYKVVNLLWRDEQVISRPEKQTRFGHRCGRCFIDQRRVRSLRNWYCSSADCERVTPIKRGWRLPNVVAWPFVFFALTTNLSFSFLFALFTARVRYVCVLFWNVSARSRANPPCIPQHADLEMFNLNTARILRYYGCMLLKSMSAIQTMSMLLGQNYAKIPCIENLV